MICLYFIRCTARTKVDSLYIRYFSWEDSIQPHIITCTNFEYEMPYTEYCVSDKNAINRHYGNDFSIKKAIDIIPYVVIDTGGDRV